MHHPAFCNIVSTINDYFMLVDDNSKCEIEEYIDESNEYEPQYGVVIKRKLSKGWINVVVIGAGEDDDTVEFNYVADSQSEKVIDSILIEDNDYSREAIRDAIRCILRQDKNASKNK